LDHETQSAANEDGESEVDVPDKGKTVKAKGKKKCREKRGAVAPPRVWIRDPRPRQVDSNAINLDVLEQSFQPSQVIPDAQQCLTSANPWQATNNVEVESQNLSQDGNHFLLDLSMACRAFRADPSNCQNTISGFLQLLKRGGEQSGGKSGERSSERSSEQSRFTQAIRSHMSVDGLLDLADRCALTEQAGAVASFAYMINCIQLRCKVIESVNQLIVHKNHSDDNLIIY
jgi:hypothetical protein